MSAGRTALSWRRLKMTNRIWSCVLLGLVMCGTYVTHAADGARATGLRGVLPEGVPADLVANIAQLPENWASWGEGLSAELATLYDQADADVNAQGAALAALQVRLKTIAKALADPKYK